MDTNLTSRYPLDGGSLLSMLPLKYERGVTVIEQPKKTKWFVVSYKDFDGAKQCEYFHATTIGHARNICPFNGIITQLLD